MKLYAFTTTEIPKHNGYLKIGETNGDVEKRVEQECHELNVQKEIVWRDAVMLEHRGIDKMIHRYLVNQGFQIQQFDATGQDTEWVKCTVTDIEKAFAEIKKQLYNEDKREKLSQKFYEELRNWYFWATEESNDPDYSLRIIIRLLLCFFLKEKGLISNDIFDKDFVEKNLKENEFNYYNVIIRNLFFYSLGTPQDKRNELEKRNEIFHYSNLKKLYKNIPFLNGGLFTEHSSDKFSLNNDYFFSAPRTKNIKELDGKYSVAGIIRILSQYNYTLDETDYSEFIDPEFIGKMFECLLACIDADS
ncbi:MAG: GIY-YIG nuclease family protein, partial [Planctomycetaceae bacterium]|nr:GIY-YIG nuclease family protein [Planctomycetaceae bacterium]